MKLHANARTCPHSRGLAVDRVVHQGWTLAATAEAAGVSVRTISKWLCRYRAEGEQGLLDRCSAPGSVPLRTSDERVAVIAALRRLRMTGAEIAETLAMPLSTVSGILTRIGLGKGSVRKSVYAVSCVVLVGLGSGRGRRRGIRTSRPLVVSSCSRGF
jgi:transposase